MFKSRILPLLIILDTLLEKEKYQTSHVSDNKYLNAETNTPLVLL